MSSGKTYSCATKIHKAYPSLFIALKMRWCDTMMQGGCIQMHWYWFFGILQRDHLVLSHRILDFVEY